MWSPFNFTWVAILYNRNEAGANRRFGSAAYVGMLPALVKLPAHRQYTLPVLYAIVGTCFPRDIRCILRKMDTQTPEFWPKEKRRPISSNPQPGEGGLNFGHTCSLVTGGCGYALEARVGTKASAFPLLLLLRAFPWLLTDNACQIGSASAYRRRNVVGGTSVPPAVSSLLELFHKDDGDFSHSTSISVAPSPLIRPTKVHSKELTRWSSGLAMQLLCRMDTQGMHSNEAHNVRLLPMVGRFREHVSANVSA